MFFGNGIYRVMIDRHTCIPLHTQKLDKNRKEEKKYF